jgi:hypothetical protein
MTLTLEKRASLEVSAASGCVVHDGRVLVVADDDVSLHVYSLEGRVLQIVRLFADVMPADEHARKKVKPDLEALAALPDGSVLAIGSGSSPRRARAARVTFSAAGPQVQVIDCAPLFAKLATEFEQLNIEGLVVFGDELLLGQRGNGAKRENALVHLRLSTALSELAQGVLTPASLLRVDPLSLGELDGVPLSLTDLALAPDGTLRFTAASEDTDDPYVDGECTGSVVGALEGAHVKWTQALTPIVKIEGLAHLEGDRWLMVADADDPTVKAPLFTVPLPLSP